jgi:hypothetical protein
MNVRIIPEDDENDQFLLKPLFEAMFKHLGKSRADLRSIVPSSPAGRPSRSGSISRGLSTDSHR